MLHPRLVFLILLCVIGVLWRIIGYWRRKTGEAAFAAARSADTAGKRDYYSRLAVMAGHREACRMFGFAHPDIFEDKQPLRVFMLHGVRVVFYGYYYPSRYGDLLDDRQRAFCHSLYRFKEGKTHGIPFFKACMTALQTDGQSCHVMFMPCSDQYKYVRRFKRLARYIDKCRPELTSGFHDVDVFGFRESLHKAKGNGNRILERNYRINGDIAGKEIVIVDDVLTSGQSLADYKDEIERCGGKVAAAIFYGKTITVPSLFRIKAHVWFARFANRHNGKMRHKDPHRM